MTPSQLGHSTQKSNTSSPEAELDKTMGSGSRLWVWLGLLLVAGLPSLLRRLSTTFILTFLAGAGAPVPQSLLSPADSLSRLLGGHIPVAPPASLEW